MLHDKNNTHNKANSAENTHIGNYKIGLSQDNDHMHVYVTDAKYMYIHISCFPSF